MIFAKLVSFLTRPSRKELLKKIDIIRERGLVFEEEAYDLKWHLEQRDEAIKRLTFALQQATSAKVEAEEKMDEFSDAFSSYQEGEDALQAERDMWKSRCSQLAGVINAEMEREDKKYQALLREMENSRLRKQDLDEQAAIQCEMDEHRVAVERELQDTQELYSHCRRGYEKCKSDRLLLCDRLKAEHQKLMEVECKPA